MWILWVILGLCAAAMIAAACIMRMFLKSFRSYDDLAFINSMSGDMAQYVPMLREKVQANREITTELLSLQTTDGETLFADLYRAEGVSKGTILLAHGFRGGRADFSCAIPLYHQWGWDLLLIDQRAQGRSTGKRMGLGVSERHDIAAWAALMAEKRPGQPLFLAGISMGATSVTMACGLSLPPEVRGIIADCGFTSPYDIFNWLIHREHAPKLLLPLCQLIAKPVLGYGLKDCSTIDVLAKSTLPILLVHGENDRFVPCDMGLRNYTASISKDKTLITVPGATHGMSYLVEPQRCEAALQAFLARNS